MLNGKKFERRCNLIITILLEEWEKGRKCCWTSLYNKLVKQEDTKISPNYFGNYLDKLEKEKLISIIEKKKKRKEVEIYITDLGKDFYKNRVDFDELTMYQKSQYLLISFIGTGVTYDGSKMSQKEISIIHSRNNYNSISLNEVKKGYVSKKNRLLGHIHFDRDTNKHDELQNHLDFLVTKGILSVKSTKTDKLYLMKSKELIDFFSKCHSFFYHVFSFLKFIFSYVRRSNSKEKDMLSKLFGPKFYNELEIGCNTERTRVNNLIKKVGQKVSDTLDLKLLIEHQLTRLNKLFERLVEYSKPLQNQYFIVSMMFRLIFPEFLRKKEVYLKSLKIISTKYIWSTSSLSYI